MQRVALDKRPKVASRRRSYPGSKKPRTGSARRSALQEAIKNFWDVWAANNESRYSSGDKPILYTAPLKTTCYSEAGYHFYNWFVKEHAVLDELESPYICYTVKVDGPILDFMKCVSDHAKMTSNGKVAYKFCWDIASSARGAGAAMLRVPSARAANRDCIPVLVQSVCQPPSSVEKLFLGVSRAAPSKIAVRKGKNTRKYYCIR
ncbi:RES domain-containing protein [Yoonia sp. GPGPB17]|uniref:RES domain-containing protein n=1 Tax=Yoonia sp. GPGPB17 TaxID=3026147 RepID=UPI004040C9F5